MQTLASVRVTVQPVWVVQTAVPAADGGLARGPIFGAGHAVFGRGLAASASTCCGSREWRSCRLSSAAALPQAFRQAARTDSGIMPRVAPAFRPPQAAAPLQWQHGHAPGSCAAVGGGLPAVVRSSCWGQVAAPNAVMRPPRFLALSLLAQAASSELVTGEAPAAAAAATEWQQRSPEVVAAVDGNPTGMQITFLGTGASVLTPGRHATAESYT